MDTTSFGAHFGRSPGARVLMMNAATLRLPCCFVLFKQVACIDVRIAIRKLITNTTQNPRAGRVLLSKQERPSPAGVNR